MCNYRRIILSLVAVLLTFMGFCASASAQQEPLKLAFVNASKSGGGDAYDLVKKFLDASDDIEVLNSDKVWDEAEEVGVSKKDFRSSSRRQESAREFRSVMKNLGIEAILIQDVFSRGRKFQLVVIGPSGEEVADIRKSIKRGRLKKSQTKEVLKEAFGELVPKVRDFRDNGGWAAYEEPEPEEEKVVEEEEEEEDSFDLVEDEEEEEPSVPGEYGLASGYRFSFGALVGSRNFSLTSEEGFQLDHKSPWLGLQANVRAVFATFGKGNQAIGANIFGGYAPFTTVFDGTDEFASDFARIGGELMYIHAIDENISIDVFAGGEARSITIAQNEFYTGNKYIGARAGAFAKYASGVLSIGAGGAILPTFSINNSNGAYGDADGLALGFEANAMLGFDISDQINISVGYTFQTISVDYPEPKVVEPTQALTGSDTIHSGTVMLGYML